MRKWQDLAPPDDPNSWYDVDGVWPTRNQTYETVDFLTGTNYTASAAADPDYAFCGLTLSGAGRREFIHDVSHIWEWSAGAFTDRSGGVSTVGVPMMCQYGEITLCAMGVGNSTLKSTTGGNFSTLTGAPQAEILVIQSNAVVAFNTNTSVDGWAASDVGDYTNWTTGEAASGRIIATPGPITAAVAFGNDIIVFKANAIYRMRYVGGTVKWVIELIHSGIGCGPLLPGSNGGKYMIAAGTSGILFVGYSEYIAVGDVVSRLFYFDGVSPPVLANPATTVLEGPIVYNPFADMFAVTPYGYTSKKVYFFCPSVNAWGKWTPTFTTNVTVAAVQGQFAARNLSSTGSERSSMPVIYEKTTANLLKRWEHAAAVVTGDTAGSCYLQTSMVGQVDIKTKFTRLIPLLRKRRDLGSDSATAEVKLYRELHDTTAQTTIGSIAESSFRKRFDLLQSSATENFARFKVTFAALDVEVDNFLIKVAPAGEE